MKKLIKKTYYTINKYDNTYGDYSEFPLNILFETKEDASEYLHTIIYSKAIKNLEEELKEEDCIYDIDNPPFWRFETHKGFNSDEEYEGLYLKVNEDGEEVYHFYEYLIKKVNYMLYTEEQ